MLVVLAPTPHHPILHHNDDLICREGGVGFFPAVVVLVELRVRRAWGGGGGKRESLSKISPLCSEQGQAFNSLFSLHSHHAALYFCDYRSTNSSEDYSNM